MLCHPPGGRRQGSRDEVGEHGAGVFDLRKEGLALLVGRVESVVGDELHHTLLEQGDLAQEARGQDLQLFQLRERKDYMSKSPNASERRCVETCARPESSIELLLRCVVCVLCALRLRAVVCVRDAHVALCVQCVARRVSLLQGHTDDAIEAYQQKRCSIRCM